MRRVFLLAIMLVCLSSCALFQGATTVTSLSPKAQAVVLMDTYIREIQDLQSMSAIVGATDAQKQAFKTKQSILVKVHPLIDAYNADIDAGGTGNAAVLNQINTLLNQLVAAGGK